MKKTILIVGSLNMDYTAYVKYFPNDGETVKGLARIVQAGGKGANQAVAVARSGLVNTFFIGSRGNDYDGDRIEKILKNDGIETHIKISKEETGNATILVGSNSQNKIVTIAGANADLFPEDIDIELIKKCDCVILQNEIPIKTNEFIIKKAHELGKIVIYNPAPYEDIDKSIYNYVDYFIANEIELVQSVNVYELDKGIEKILSLGVKNVIITLGCEGSQYSNGKDMIKCDAYKVNAVDSVSAGDTYVGYFASVLISGKTVEESMKIASKASSITVTRKGSIVSIPHGNEIDLLN